jgi:hypothetical protein
MTFNLRNHFLENERRQNKNYGGDPELNFLNRDYLRNNLQFSVFNL